MKIALIIVSCLLVVTSALGGFFLFRLNDQLDDMELFIENQFANVRDQIADIDDLIDTTKESLDDALEASETRYDAALAEQQSMVTDYQTSTASLFSEVQSDIASAISKAGNLSTQLAEIKDNMLFSADLYAKVKDSIVTLSNGDELMGTGFVLEGSKNFVTAYHVVEELTSPNGGYSLMESIPVVRVTFPDGLKKMAYLEMYSEELDIAILRIPFFNNNNQMPPEYYATMDFNGIPLADSGTVKPGEPIFVIGSPGDEEEYRLGLKETMTSGIISQTNRCATVEDVFRTNLIQFDAAVNYGNSGSPLVNKDGEVIGMVIARMNPLFGDGISMAVTSNQIAQVEAAIIDPTDSFAVGEMIIGEADTYPYPYSGIIVSDVMDMEVIDDQLITYTGAKVTSAQSPATGARIEIDDIIVGVGDHEVTSADEFFCLLAEYYKVGDTVTLKIKRGLETMEKTFTLTDGS